MGVLIFGESLEGGSWLREILKAAVRRFTGLQPSKTLAELEAEVAELRRWLLSGRKVDMVDFGELRFFMYTDDLSYVQLDERYKHKKPDGIKRTLRDDTRSPADRYNNPKEALISLILSHFWLHDLEFTVLDVGCQYGISSVATAQIIRNCGKGNRVIAFDPGVAGRLVQFNIALNGIEDLVSFEAMAVSDGDLPSIVFSELGHSENNRIVDRFAASEFQSYVVMSTSIDGYLAKRGIEGHLFAKIDTQGGEVEVLRGMAKAMRERLVVAIIELTPHAIEARVDVGDWLRSLAADYDVMEVDSDVFLRPAAVIRIERDGIDAYIAEVRKREQPNSDLLLIPKNLPGRERLLQKLPGRS